MYTSAGSPRKVARGFLGVRYGGAVLDVEVSGEGVVFFLGWGLRFRFSFGFGFGFDFVEFGVGWSFVVRDDRPCRCSLRFDAADGAGCDERFLRVRVISRGS